MIYLKISKILSALGEHRCSRFKKKNYISLFSNYFLIFYASKIKFRRFRLRKKYSMNLKKSFSNLILQNKTKCQKQNES